MSSFVISVTNNTGYDLTEVFAPSSSGYIILSSFSTIVNGTSAEIEIELDSPKDPFYGQWSFSIPSHPFKYILTASNPFGSFIDGINMGGTYNGQMTHLSAVNLAGISGCVADRMEIILTSISPLISILT